MADIDIVDFETKKNEYKEIKLLFDERPQLEKYICHLGFLSYSIAEPCTTYEIFINEEEKIKYIEYLQKIYDNVIKTKFYKKNMKEINTEVDKAVNQTKIRYKYLDKALELYLKVCESDIFPDDFLDYIGPQNWIEQHILYRFILENWKKTDYNYLSAHIKNEIILVIKDDFNMNDITIDKKIINPVLKNIENWTEELYEYMKYMTESHSYDFCEECKQNLNRYGFI